MLRTLFVAFFLSLYILLVGPPLLIYTAITKNPNAVYWGGVRGVLFFVRAAGVKIRVRGLERIPEGVCLFAANHTSSADAPAVVGAIPRRVAILLKESLFRWPIVGQAFRSAHFIPVDRGARDSAIASIEKAAEAMGAGQSFLIYPEGTRSPDGRLQEFKKGAVVMAIRAGVPIVPMALVGMREKLPMGSIHLRSGRVLLRIGEPVPTSGMAIGDRVELTQRLYSAITGMLKTP